MSLPEVGYLMSGRAARQSVPAAAGPGARVEFLVLGDLEVHAAGERIVVGHARQRSVLAVLLLDLGRVVSTDQLIDRVWGDGPPSSVRNVLYGYVAKLKAAIAKAADPEVALARRPGGYLLDADPERVDLYRFRRLAAEAAAGDDQQAAALLRDALRLWHGPALAGLDSPWLNGMRDTLGLQRVTAVLDLGDIALRQGQHAALIGELAAEAIAYPTDERLTGQLMLALYRSGLAGRSPPPVRADQAAPGRRARRRPWTGAAGTASADAAGRPVAGRGQARRRRLADRPAAPASLRRESCPQTPPPLPGGPPNSLNSTSSWLPRAQGPVTRPGLMPRKGAPP